MLTLSGFHCSYKNEFIYKTNGFIYKKNEFIYKTNGFIYKNNEFINKTNGLVYKVIENTSNKNEFIYLMVKLICRNSELIYRKEEFIYKRNELSEKLCVHFSQRTNTLVLDLLCTQQACKYAGNFAQSWEEEVRLIQSA